MKIKDIVLEGFWKNVGAMGKGIAQGVADVVAPGAVDDLSKSFRQANAAKKGQKGASKPGNVLYKGNEYQWLGGQWGLVNPATGKAVPAPKELQKQLNFMSTRKSPADYQKAATSQQTQQAPATPTVQGFKVLDQDPIRIAYKKKEYGLNAQGEWVDLDTRGTKVPLVKEYNPTLEKLLDRAAGMEQSASPNAQPTQTPAPTQTQQPTQQANEPTIIGKVTAPGGEEVVKWSDGVWTIPASEEQIVKPNDLKQLEALLKQQQARA
jgi:hypothetical protein